MTPDQRTPERFKPHQFDMTPTSSNRFQYDQLNKTPRDIENPLHQPVWDRERRELRVGKTLVKRFRWPAENQECVLDAFQDNGWPDHLANPLEPRPGICPKRRLHDTLKCLNRKQLNEAIKFRGDGTGLGVLLEFNIDCLKKIP